MRSLQLLTVIFIIELIILAVGGLIISLLNVWLKIRQSKQKRLRETVFNRIFTYLFSSDQEAGSFLLDKSEIKVPVLIGIIEDINQKIDDERWKELRSFLIEQYLRNQAYKSYRSLFWMKRNNSARILMQDPRPEEEKYILKLLNDPILLVRIHAVNAAQKLGTASCFRKMLEEFVKDKGFSSYIYRDAFLNAGLKSFMFLKVELLSHPSVEYKIICLELLANRVYEKLDYHFQADFLSDNPDLRLAAIKCYTTNPDESLNETLLQLLFDEDWRIRGFCAYKLGELKIKKAIPYLLKSIQDKVWWVRLNSAISLKNLEQEGLFALKNIDPDIDHYAYDMSRYILAMSEGEM